MKNSSAERQRYSPERAYRPLVSPPSVEDKDACAIYASVRRDATPSHEPITLALESLQKMLHRAGNVDGEGDGCGLLVDIPTKIWAEEVRQGGHNPALALDDAFAVAHVFVERSQDLEKDPARRPRDPRRGRLPDPRRAGRRRRLRRARPDRPRGGAAVLAVRRPRPRGGRRRPHPLQPEGHPRGEARRPRRLLLGQDLRLQGDGQPEGARVLLRRPLRRAHGDDRGLRPQPLLDQHLALVHPRPALRRPRPQRRDQHDRAAPPGGADARSADRRGQLRLPGPEPHDRDAWSAATASPWPRRWRWWCRRSSTRSPALPDELHSFYMYLRQTMGPFAQGPVALIARHRDECVFSADAMGLRPLWQLETAAGLRLQLRARRRLGRRDDLRAEADGPGREVHGPDRPRPQARRRSIRTRRCCARSASAGSTRTGTDAGRAVSTARSRPAARSRAPRSRATPTPAPRSRSRSRTACSPASAGSATTSSSSSRWPTTAPSRSARSATTGRSPRSRPSARTSPTTSRRRSPSSPTRRSTASARSSTSRPAPSSAAARRSADPSADSQTVETDFPVILGGHHDLAPLAAQRLPPDRQRAGDLPARGPLGGVRRPRQGDRHRAARVGDDPGRDRAAQAGGGEGGQRGRRAARPHRPHRLRRRAPLHRSPPGDLGDRPGAEAVRGRAPARRTCAAAARSCCARRRSATSTT